MSNSFFNHQTEQSKVKAEIVSCYFSAWANVMITQSPKIAYFDLYSGPGYYEDGSKSTPLLLLDKVFENEKICNAFVSLFNDSDPNNIAALKESIESHEKYSSLKYNPEFLNTEVDDEIAEQFESLSLIPSLLFVDPWGYKGLSCRLIRSVLKDWGCDCIFFFNYNRINAAISNPNVEIHMEELFGRENLDRLNDEVSSLGNIEREKTVLKYVEKSLKDIGGDYVVTFKFMSEQGTKTSHFLIFVSKHILGHNIMKDVMAKRSTLFEHNVPNFIYDPSMANCFDLYNPIEELKPKILSDLAGKQMTVQELYNTHNPGTHYIKKNYKTALLELESTGHITIERPISKRKTRQISDKAKISFP